MHLAEGGIAKANHHALGLSTRRQVARCKVLEENTQHIAEDWLKQMLGIRGPNLGVQCILYLSFTDSFPLPIHHLLLRGVLHDLLKVMLGPDREVHWLEK